jgi:hypothetical protein
MTWRRTRRALWVCRALPLLACLSCKDATKSTPEAAPSASPAPSTPAVGVPISAASVAAIVNPDQLPTYQGPTGSIEGTIVITGDPPPPLLGKNFATCPAATQTRAHLFRVGAAVNATDGGLPARQLADAIVAVIGYKGFVAERNEARTLIVDECENVPRTIDLTFGQRLEVQNKTKVLFAPSLDEANHPALMVAPPGGDFIKVYVPKPGHFAMTDKLGGDFFSADVYALLHPFHATSGNDGHYRINGIPIGEITVGARLAAIGQESMKTLTVLGGVVHRVDLTLNYVVHAAPKEPAGTSGGQDAGKVAPVLR